MRYVFLLRQYAGPICTMPELSGQPTLADTISAFCLTGCGLHCRQALLSRDRKTAPVQCVTLTAQSGKVTHDALLTCTRQINCTSPRLDSDTAFSGHLLIRRT